MSAPVLTEQALPPAPAAPKRSSWSGYLRQPTVALSVLVLLVMALMAVFASVIADEPSGAGPDVLQPRPGRTGSAPTTSGRTSSPRWSGAPGPVW